MERFADMIEAWYEQHGRDLPWRNTDNPYRIWISEVILQQTRVAQGYDYFLRFVERFPTVQALAGASEDEVMRMWQGLGYYSRARHLHAAARAIVRRGGTFPETYEGVRALPGIGDYTAAAICAFAYGLPRAVVDGNVYRVLARWAGIGEPTDTAKGKRLFADLAGELLDKERPAAYNQAIMDFGALQCTPRLPDCPSCPLAGTCVAYAEGRVAELPVRAHKTKVTDRYFNYIYVRAGASILIRRRTGNDIWKGLYEFPLIESPGEWGEETFYASGALRELLAGGESPLFRCLWRGVRHVLSHQVIHATFYEAVLPDDADSFPGYVRVSPDEVDRYALPRLLHQFLERFA